MTRWLAALLGCLFLAGCPQAIPPEEPRPILVLPDDGRDVRDDSSDGADEQTRQRALRVFASEQRSVVNGLEDGVRFVRVGSRTRERLRAELVSSERELSSIERAIEVLGRNDSLSFEDRHQRQDELKDQLRRLASRLALLETTLREG